MSTATLPRANRKLLGTAENNFFNNWTRRRRYLVQFSKIRLYVVVFLLLYVYVLLRTVLGHRVEMFIRIRIPLSYDKNFLFICSSCFGVRLTPRSMFLLPEQLFRVMKILLIDAFWLLEHLFSLPKLLQTHRYGVIPAQKSCIYTYRSVIVSVFVDRIFEIVNL